MHQSLLERIFLIVCSVIFIALGIYLLQQETITLHGRITMNRYPIEYSGIILFSSASFSAALMFGLLATNKSRFKNISGNLFIVSFILFTIGYFI